MSRIVGDDRDAVRIRIGFRVNRGLARARNGDLNPGGFKRGLRSGTDHRSRAGSVLVKIDGSESGSIRQSITTDQIQNGVGGIISYFLHRHEAHFASVVQVNLRGTCHYDESTKNTWQCLFQ